ncbi:MAG: hypothetical protein LBQ59_01320 [Candidatus Peribacteria bacterium]|jgi:hypothetical protein|nr:hypothetical protein [Candidatus Peribacteria bacterium]
MAAIEISPSEERDTIQRMRSMMDKPRRLGDLTDEQIASMLFVIEDWERRGINGELTKKFRDILRRYGEKREALILATKRNIENEKARGEAERREAEKARQVKPKKSQPSEKPQEAPAKPETSAPLTVDRINKQTKSITKIIEDNDISKAELDSINYEEIKKIFRQSLNDTEESGEIVKSIAELDEVLAKLLELYRTRRKDSSFEPHEKYEGFLKDI